MISNLSSKESGCGCGGGGMSGAAPCGCGGAGCGSCIAQGVVRPRFFAGQLLTEDDLQLLSDYVGQKNRLHNRHLFGAGVVCGLEVACDPCGDGRVIVQPGYAIDCCGNDLALTCPTGVDLNALVRKLRKNECEEPCRDPRKLKGRTNKGEDDEETDEDKPRLRYCLYIRYCENESDPVTPYSTGEECVQVGCEATRIREGVTLELRCVDPHVARNPLLERLCQRLGDLDKLPRVFEAFSRLRRQAETIAILKKRIESPPEVALPSDDRGLSGRVERKRLSPDGLRIASESFDIVRNWLVERLSKSSFITDCTLRARVYDLILPRGDDPDLDLAGEAVDDLIVLFIDYLRAAVCSVLNPACLPCEDSAVLLACLDWEECEVKKICNMERTFVLSPAAVRYWLPPLQLAGNLLERLCCLPWEDFPRKDQSPLEDRFELDLKELLKQEIQRIIKDSICGLRDDDLDSAVAGINRMFRSSSNKGQAFDMSMFGVGQSTQDAPAAPPENLSGESTAADVDLTSVPGSTKGGAKKTGMKAGKKASTKSGSKASAAATQTNTAAAPAPAAAPVTTATPASTPAATGASTAVPAPTATATTTQEGDKK